MAVSTKKTALRRMAQWPAGVWIHERGQGTESFPVLSEADFHAVLRLERRRTERSERPFLLLLAAFSERATPAEKEDFLARFALELSASSRETDIFGWNREGQELGAIFTELGRGEGPSDERKRAAFNVIQNKTAAALDELLGDDSHRLSFSLHFFPEDFSEKEDPVRWLQDEHSREKNSERTARRVKRALDIAGSSLGLLVLFPILLVVSALVKLTSRGPVLFRQTRVGQHGRNFTFLKFRSMYRNSDSGPHQEYVGHFIAGKAPMKESADGKASAYKLIDDPRVTPFGRFLRKTSLDELPQLLNVLRGEMSLVGPRPPLPYEFACYGTWHRRRIAEVKPGITGLWQVSRKREVETDFQEWIYYDVQYVKKQSLWLDIKILFKTIRVMLRGT